METKTLNAPKKIKQEVQLVKGEFTPSEAAHVIMSLIDEKINFHKLQRLQKWEGDHICNTNELDGRIGELQKEKEIAKGFIKEARKHHGKIAINGVLEITIIED